MTERIRAGRRWIGVTHADRVMFPEAGVTKLDLARHYVRVSPAMVPHVRDRPLAVQVFPRGVDAGGFFLKDRPRHFPGWIPTARVPKRGGGTLTQVLANGADTLAYLASQNVVTTHVWTSRGDRLEEPDRIIFDLDPPASTSFAEVRAVARALGELLRDLGLRPFAMTTGSRGLHVTVALRRGADYAAVHGFAREVASVIARRHPRVLSTEFHRERRGERIYVDVGRNAYGQHAVAPYSVRALPSAPVATPLEWEELRDRRLTPQRWTVASTGARLDELGDPWEAIAGGARALSHAQRALTRIG